MLYAYEKFCRSSGKNRPGYVPTIRIYTCDLLDVRLNCQVFGCGFVQRGRINKGTQVYT